MLAGEEVLEHGVLPMGRRELNPDHLVEQRKLGQTLYLSEIYHVVETTEGVQSSECWLDSGKTRVVPDGLDQVLVLSLTSIKISHNSHPGAR